MDKHQDTMSCRRAELQRKHTVQQNIHTVCCQTVHTLTAASNSRELNKAHLLLKFAFASFAFAFGRRDLALAKLCFQCLGLGATNGT